MPESLNCGICALSLFFLAWSISYKLEVKYNHRNVILKMATLKFVEMQWCNLVLAFSREI